MKCETRLPHFHSFAFANVSIGSERATEIGRINGAVGIQTFRKTEHDFLPCVATGPETNDTSNILAEVKNVMAGFWLSQFDRDDFSELANGRPGMRLDRPAVRQFAEIELAN